MEETKINYIPVGQARKIKNIKDKTIGFNRYIKINKIKLIIGAVAIGLICTYIILLRTFVAVLETLI